MREFNNYNSKIGFQGDNNENINVNFNDAVNLDYNNENLEDEFAVLKNYIYENEEILSAQVNDLEEAIKEKDTPKVLKLFNFVKENIGLIPPIIELGKSLGIITV